VFEPGPATNCDTTTSSGGTTNGQCPSGEFVIGTDVDGTFTSYTELAAALSKSAWVKECVARQAFRYFSAQHDRSVERSYVELRDALAGERRGNLVEEVVHYAKSDLFVRREVRQ